MKQAIAGLLLSAVLDAHAVEPLSVPPMVTIPGGTFTMGSMEPTIGDGSHNPGEQPPHAVQIKSYRMAQYETTVGQFRQFVEATGYKTQDQCWKFDKTTMIALQDGKWDTPAYAPTEFHPVTCVTWEDANAYAQWLSQRTSRQFRLPSEAEWEYAARSGSNSRYPWGDDADRQCEFANVRDQRFKTAVKRDIGLELRSAVASCDDGAEYTTIVGMYAPNAFGLYDMIGNVAEWVADCQHANYDGAPSDGSAWTTGCNTEEDYFITRGGAYSSSLLVVRSAARGHGGRTNASSLGEGFRIAEDIVACEKTNCSVNAMDARFVANLASAQQLERRRPAQGK